ncbi:MAG: [protein-PII] uridylyltransferase family protein, partial [Planctomycetota bacterium]
MSEGPAEDTLEELQQELLADLEAGDDAALMEGLRAFRRRALEEAARRFAPPRGGRPCSEFICRACDVIGRKVADVCRGSSNVPATAWTATGGYGRGLMSPASTVRLVLLHDGHDPDAVSALARRAASLLSGAGLEAVAVAHSVPEALRSARDDYVTAVSLMESRLVAGEDALHQGFRRALLEQFLPERWGRFVEEALREALAHRDPFTGSPYSTEPNLKDGAGCLRDVGTAQKVGFCLSRVAELEGAGDAFAHADVGLLRDEEAERLWEALDFMLRARNRLHFLQQDGSDVLHRRVQPEVASALGFADGPEGSASMTMMRELFRHAGRVVRILRALNERFLHVHRVAWRRGVSPQGRALADGFAEVEGRIYSATRPPFSGGEDGARMMRLFLLSQRRHLPVSQQLLDLVSESLDLVDEGFQAAEEVGKAFLDLLSGSVGVAERIAWMRDCGLLQASLPGFAPLVHLVDGETRRDHTLDEHAVEALRVIDELGHTQERSDLAQREVLEQVERPDLLRLAILLHDADCAAGADYRRVVAEAADRIGLKPT